MHGAIMKTMMNILAFALFLTLVGNAVQARAQSPFENSYTADEARDARKQGRVLGASEVMRIVQQRFPHLRVADARLVSNNRQGSTYRVKLLSADNRVVEVTVDAKTGQILGTRGN